MHKRFRSEEATLVWLANKRASGFGDHDSDSGYMWGTLREDSEIPQAVGGCLPPNDPSTPWTSLSLDRLVNLKTVGPGVHFCHRWTRP
jgi:hypothetical protein